MFVLQTVVGSGNWTHLAYATMGREDKRLIVVLEPTISKAEFEAIAPNPSDLLRVDPTGQYIHGVVLTTSPENAEFQGYTSDGEDGGQAAVDYACRYFAPWVGLNEDPACGSAQCALAPYWTGRLNKREGTRLRGNYSVTFVITLPNSTAPALQCYPGRGADFIAQLSPDGKRVILRGSGVTVVRGRLLVC